MRTTYFTDTTERSHTPINNLIHIAGQFLDDLQPGDVFITHPEADPTAESKLTLVETSPHNGLTWIVDVHGLEAYEWSVQRFRFEQLLERVEARYRELMLAAYYERLRQEATEVHTILDRVVPQDGDLIFRVTRLVSAYSAHKERS